ncbi:MAG TPA: HlyD family type I secretion periplasmic adaptor subunit [Rhizomicrobium sp.]|nr:HlyD family type I secretion periplasmic adaptor subunit [Rhizomicrobium sp.]
MTDTGHLPAETDGQGAVDDAAANDGDRANLPVPRYSFGGVMAPAWHWMRLAFAGPDVPTPEDEQLTFLRTGRVVRIALSTVVVFVFGALAWAAFAPLESALMAPGVLVVESHRKDIQHLEGGIVKEIYVKDGDSVKAGQTLIKLDDTQARVQLALLQDEADGLEAQEARLIALRDGDDHVSFPPDLLARQNDPKVAEDIRGEEKTFETKRSSLTEQIGILNQRKGENGKVISGLKAEQQALDTQITLINEEAGNVQQMVDKGLEPLPRLLALQRQAADLTGQRGQVLEKMSQVDLNNGETDIQIVNLRSQALDDELKDLRDVQSKRFDLQDRIQAARDVLMRTSLTTPVSGKVVDLSVHTRGAVIKPGETVMEVVPQKDALEVEAHVRPEDAEYVYAGQEAKVTLTSYLARRLPQLSGRVETVSADRLTDQRTGQAYFVAVVSVDRNELKPFPDVRLIPGMPAQVAIQTGTRTALDYFIEPIRDVIRNGMKER